MGNAQYYTVVHYVALICNHGIVRITHCRWHCGLLITQGPISLLYNISMAMVYDAPLLLGDDTNK